MRRVTRCREPGYKITNMFDSGRMSCTLMAATSCSVPYGKARDICPGAARIAHLNALLVLLVKDCWNSSLVTEERQQRFQAPVSLPGCKVRRKSYPPSSTTCSWGCVHNCTGGRCLLHTCDVGSALGAAGVQQDKNVQLGTRLHAVTKQPLQQGTGWPRRHAAGSHLLRPRCGPPRRTVRAATTGSSACAQGAACLQSVRVLTACA